MNTYHKLMGGDYFSCSLNSRRMDFFNLSKGVLLLVLSFSPISICNAFLLSGTSWCKWEGQLKIFIPPPMHSSSVLSNLTVNNLYLSLTVFNC